GDPTGGHRSTCLERHFATFPGQTRLTVFPDRSVFRLLGGRRSGYAVAAWQAPGTAVDPAAWRRRAVAAEARPAACCHWAEAPSLPRRVA
ncbi:MAG TPA: hypothetical protein VF170_11745, partial [Planctomycetaceae bacterium]